jgi:glycine/D-amino acid oxidase-like deaminating enzyme
MVDPAQTDESLPERAEIVVIGGGIAGVSTALFLAERGVEVVLCEKGYIGAEQSSRNWGWVTARNRDIRELPLCLASERLWAEMNERVGFETGYRRTGSLRAFSSLEALETGVSWLEDARQFDFPARAISAAEISNLVPGFSGSLVGGLYAQNDGLAEPQKAAPTIANGARRRGAKVFTRCAVRGLELAAGRVEAVVTERGRIRCSTAIIAGGGWSTLLLRRLGVRLPQLLVQASAMRTVPHNRPITPTVYGDHFSLRKRLDGGFTIGDPFSTLTEITPDAFRFASDYMSMLALSWRRLKPRFGLRALREWVHARSWELDQTSPFEQVRVLDPVPTRTFLARTHRALVAALPDFAEVPIAQQWAGLLDITPDAIPVISDVPKIPGLFTICGFSGHGFGMGPGAGHLMADLATGQTPIVDPRSFRFSRFTDGSNPKPKAGF